MLKEFKGTLIFVSHDRYFIEKFAERIWVLDDGVIRDFKCGYSKYRSILEHEAMTKPVVVEVETKPKKEKPKGGTKEIDKLIRRLEREIEKQEALVAENIHVAAQEFAVVGDNGAVVMVVGGVFVDVPGQTGIEDGVRTHGDELFDVTVHDLCRVARRIGRDRELSEFVRAAGGVAGNDRREAEIFKNSVPQREQFEHSERHREADHAAFSDRFRNLVRAHREKFVPLVFVQVRHIRIDVFDAETLFALVAGDEARAAREGIDGQQAVVRASAALGGL